MLHTTAARTSAPGTGCPCELPAPCSFRCLVRARARTVVRGEPLLRNGYVLTLSSVVAAAIGALFWLLATRWYSAETVGRSYAALSMAALLSGIGQLNLGDVLVRFVPTAGRHSRRIVLRSYGLSTLVSGLAAGVFLLLLPSFAPQLGFLHSPGMVVAFTLSVAGYSLFVLQDGVLTGLRRPHWVLAENALFAVAKVGLLGLLVAWVSTTGILLSWSGALVVSIVVTNVYLFRRALPQHERSAPEGRPQPRMVRYATADYLGALLRGVAYNITPLLVLNELGPAASAHFALAWVVAYTFYLAALNMGNSLLVEAVRAPERLSELGRRVLRHAGLLLAVGIGVVVALAPVVLSLFGGSYAEHGTTVLRLLALSALPNLVLDVAVDVARARQALRWMVGLQAALCVMVLTLTVLLLPVIGLAGVGLAWLVAESVLAVPLLLMLPTWLPRAARSRRPGPIGVGHVT
ncbi:hypothetical protein [Kitasatospora terrestris]|uniref:Polysaccharide biosynthesis protein C-terminal domain-containing protein n=1 Tax=Kitasatospora terrestris TaxID=258051 RepID=A0ABP9E9X8_9ACTN